MLLLLLWPLPPAGPPREGVTGRQGECGEVEEAGPRVPSPLWGVDAREGGPPEAAPACPCPTSPGGCSWKPEGGAQGRGAGQAACGQHCLV